MKRIIVLFLAVMLTLSLAACGKEPVSEQQNDSSVQSGNTAESSEETVKSIELVGSWHLDEERNDLAGFADSIDLFPGYGEWGAGMEIGSDGQMSWYIGAESWHGTYTVEDGIIKAQLTSDLDQTAQLWEIDITAEEETTVLKMTYHDLAIYWVYGEQADSAAGAGND